MSAHRRRRAWQGYLFAAPYLALFCGFVALPLAFGLGLSLFHWDMLSAAPPRFAGLANYREAFRDPYFWKALGATARFVGLAVPLTLTTALALAVGVHGAPPASRSFFRAAFYLPCILTITVAGLLWRWFYNSEFGLFNAYLGRIGLKVPWLTDPNWAVLSLVLLTVWWTAGGPMIALLAGLQNVPPAVYEAAELDGATGWRRFTRITLPLLRPVLLFVGVMNGIGAFQVFGQVYIVTRGGPELSTRTMVQYIYETAFNNYRMGYAAALSWLLFAVIAGFSLLQFRWLRER